MATVLIAIGMILVDIVAMRLSRQVSRLQKKVEHLETKFGSAEDRCWKCTKQGDCPAAFSGVEYPCEHFKEEDPDGEEK